MNSGIYIAGTGNLAKALGQQLQKIAPDGYNFKGWFSRNPLNAQVKPAMPYHSVTLQKGDVVFLCVQDKQIFDVASTFSNKGCRLVHCSGAQPLASNGVKCNAAFWPMQSFSVGNSPSWQNLPVFVETEDEELGKWLIELGTMFGANVLSCQGNQRITMHLAAVLTNNFVNALYSAAANKAQSAGFKPELLHPIMQQTLLNAISKGPDNVQTGPALRGDVETMQKHLQLLENEEELLDIYRSISNYIPLLFK
jgi:predicted short-subunit dehydrogenase-like oxidoreductase (DUF2520 family)